MYFSLPLFSYVVLHLFDIVSTISLAGASIPQQLNGLLLQLLLGVASCMSNIVIVFLNFFVICLFAQKTWIKRIQKFRSCTINLVSEN